MKKILFVTDEINYGPSGVVTVIKEKINYFKKKKYKVFVLCNSIHWYKKNFSSLVGKNTISPNFLLSDEIKFLLPNSNKFIKFCLRFFLFMPLFFYNFFTALYLFIVIKKLNPEIIFNHNGGWIGGELNRIVLFLSFFLKIKKHIYIVHNYPQKISVLNFFKIKFNNFLIINSACKIITVSNDCKKKLLNYFEFKIKVETVYNGIKLYKLRKEKKLRKKINLAFFGKIEKRKGINILIDALNIQKLPLNTYIYGNLENNYAKTLVRISKNIKNKILFRNQTNNVKNVLKKIDIVILPSVSNESFGMILVEAMRSGKPIICSNFGGMKEVLINNYNGFFFDSGNPVSLYIQIKRFLSNKKLINKFGNNGYKRFLKLFTSEIMCENYQRIIK